MHIFIVIAILSSWQGFTHRIKYVSKEFGATASEAVAETKTPIRSVEGGERRAAAERQRRLNETEEKNRHRIKHDEDREARDFQDRLAEIEDEPDPYDPPEGKPWLDSRDYRLHWHPPLSHPRWSYYLVQLRQCGKWFCSQWFDFKQTVSLSWGMSRLALDSRYAYQARLKTCSRDESIEECKKAWLRWWSRISDSFQFPGASPAKMRETQQREQEIEQSESQRLAEEQKREEDLASQKLAEEQKNKMQADMDSLDVKQERERWRQQQEIERQEEIRRARKEALQVASEKASMLTSHNIRLTLMNIHREAEATPRTREGDRKIVQIYAIGARKTIEAVTRAGVEPTWMPKFQARTQGSWSNYDPTSAIRTLRHAFQEAMAAEDAEATQRIKTQRAAQSGIVSKHAKPSRTVSVPRLEPQPKPQLETHPKRISKGNTVKLSAVASKVQKDIVGGPLRRGDLGWLVHKTRGDKGYLVEALTGKAVGKRYHYDKQALEYVADNKLTDDQLVSLDLWGSPTEEQHLSLQLWGAP